MDLNKEELKEKVLCVFKNNTDKLKSYSKSSKYYSLYNTKLYIEVYYEFVRRKETFIKKGEWFWQKEKTLEKEVTEPINRYKIWTGIEYVEITEEEFLDIFETKKEEDSKKNLEELNKLCKSEL